MAGAPPVAPWLGAWLGAWVAGAWAAAGDPLPVPPHAASTLTNGMSASAAPVWTRLRRVVPGREGIRTLAVMAVAPGLLGLGTELGGRGRAMVASFAAEGVDGCQLGGPAGGVDAEHQADGQG